MHTGVLLLNHPFSTEKISEKAERFVPTEQITEIQAFQTECFEKVLDTDTAMGEANKKQSYDALKETKTVNDNTNSSFYTLSSPLPYSLQVPPQLTTIKIKNKVKFII